MTIFDYFAKKKLLVGGLRDGMTPNSNVYPGYMFKQSLKDFDSSQEPRIIRKVPKEDASGLLCIPIVT